MRPAEQLADFVRDALLAGRSRTDIQAALRNEGWSPKEISAALDSWSDGAFVPPVPRPRPYFSPRDAFIYGLIFAALAVSAWHLSTLAFMLIDQWVQSPGEPVHLYYALDGVRWSVAILVVSAPLFLLLESRSARTSQADPGRRRSAVRRWLALVTLFIALGALLGDLGTVIYRLLNGDLTLRFALKACAVGLIASVVVLYFKDETRNEDAGPILLPRLAFVVLAVVAVASGIVAMRGLEGGRQQHRDDIRADDLRNLMDHVRCLADAAGGHLPEALEPNPACVPQPRQSDPSTGAAYRYEKVTPTSFRLCAGFEWPEASSLIGGGNGLDPATGCVLYSYFWQG